MTNTHINIGGHKITTNKVGQVHEITLPSGFTGNIQWCVTNGICIIHCSGLKSITTGSGMTIASGLPRNKFSITTGGGIMPNDLGTSITGILYVNDGILKCNINVANQNGYAALQYPVADDWVES